MIWTPDPAQIVPFRQNGFGDMASLADEGSVGRFALDCVDLPSGLRSPVLVWVLVNFRCRFIGGTGNATLSLAVDHRDRGGLYDWTLEEWESAGTDGDRPEIVHRVDPLSDLFANYTFFAGDVLAFLWTNPHADTMRWILEVFLAWRILDSEAGSSELAGIVGV